METVNSLINEYLSITGRPAATLSVSEFMTFKEYADKEHDVYRINYVMHMKQKSSDNAIKIDETKEPSVFEEKKKETSNVVKIEDKDEQKKKHTEGNILSMLKSVPG